MKSINHHAPVQCDKNTQINAPIEKVWAVLTNINTWAKWQAEIQNSKLQGELKVGATFHWKTGGVPIQSSLHTVEPFEHFGWTGKTFGMFAIHNWVLQNNNGQTVVRVEESMEGLLAQVFKKTFNKNLEKGMLYWLEALKTACEA
jgi:uncharacterized protein YndB with AHSA1/START domain